MYMVDRVWVCVYMGDGMGVCACLDVCAFIWVMVYGCVCGAITSIQPDV